ncbi:MAG: hypothetical protein Q8S73_40025 [Deltaproteobacteria bacterium]|nr:hypothetical protein [Myxococcales bacterium]MDP3220354.1 hypothetical protein [Deltaproteobacteria bacterium]
MQAIDEGVPFVIQVSDARGSSLETLFPTLVGITPEAAGLIVPPASIATLRATMFYPIHMGYRAKGRAGPDGFEIDVQPPGAA